ncbi:MAG: transcriptional regulator, partial [Asticcacaulis sp.]|nr:transcriptional regulator [Asticcacaulis sp.]
KDAYLARLDIDTGTVEYQKRYAGQDGVVTPSAIAISKGGSSVLDQLGLPMGTVQQKDLAVDAKGKLENTSRIVSSTGVRTGDQFYLMDSSGAKKTITIDANETMESLATKIVRASSYRLKVQVNKMTGKPLSQLDIKPATSTTKVSFVAGPVGRDALEGLGLSAGLVSADAGKIMDAKASNYLESKKPLGLEFDNSLNLNSEANIKQAMDSLQKVMKNVQKVYNYLKYGDPQETDSKKKGSTGGTAPAYLTNQIANYQAALNRLTGGS